MGKTGTHLKHTHNEINKSSLKSVGKQSNYALVFDLTITKRILNLRGHASWRRGFETGQLQGLNKGILNQPVTRV